MSEKKRKVSTSKKRATKSTGTPNPDDYVKRLDTHEKLLREVLFRLQAHEESHDPVGEVVVVEQMDKEEVREKVLQYIRTHGSADIVELHKEIRCDIGILAEIIDELVAEGTVGE